MCCMPSRIPIKERDCDIRGGLKRRPPLHNDRSRAVIGTCPPRSLILQAPASSEYGTGNHVTIKMHAVLLSALDPDGHPSSCQTTPTPPTPPPLPPPPARNNPARPPLPSARAPPRHQPNMTPAHQQNAHAKLSTANRAETANSSATGILLRPLTTPSPPHPLPETVPAPAAS